MAPLSGPQALVVKDQVDGFLLALGRRGGKLGGLAVAIATNAGPSPVAGAQCKASLFSMAWQCPYTQVARHIGTGSTDDAANFRCVMR